MGVVLMTYREEVVKAMNVLSENEKVIFLGQSINYWDCIYKTLDNIPLNKNLELPIMEDTQMGISIGLALEGYIPITIYSRMDFLLLAMNELVNHLDKIEEMSNGEFKPKVIIRTIIGTTSPLNPGPQHCQDYTDMFKLCLKNVDVIRLERKEDIIPTYKKALESDKSTMIIEVRELYDK